MLVELDTERTIRHAEDAKAEWEPRGVVEKFVTYTGKAVPGLPRRSTAGRPRRSPRSRAGSTTNGWLGAPPPPGDVATLAAGAAGPHPARPRRPIAVAATAYAKQRVERGCLAGDPAAAGAEPRRPTTRSRLLERRTTTGRRTYHVERLDAEQDLGSSSSTCSSAQPRSGATRRRAEPSHRYHRRPWRANGGRRAAPSSSSRASATGCSTGRSNPTTGAGWSAASAGC